MDVLEDRSFQKEVDTVRALHQTVVSLRAALERSRIEIEELKERIWSSESCELALQTLSVENHILRQKIINIHEFKETTTQTSIPYITVDSFENKSDQSLENKIVSSKDTSYNEQSLNTDTNDSLVTEINKSPKKTVASPRQNINKLETVAKHASTLETVASPRKHTLTQETVASPRQNTLEKVASPRQNTTQPKTVASPKQNTIKTDRYASQRQNTFTLETTASPSKQTSALETVASPKQNTVGLERVASPRQNTTKTERFASQRQNTFTLETTASPSKNTPALETNASPKQNTVGLEKVASPRQNTIKTDRFSSQRQNTFTLKTTASPSKQTTTFETVASPRKNITFASPKENTVKTERFTSQKQNTFTLETTASPSKQTTTLDTVASPRKTVESIKTNAQSSENKKSHKKLNFEEISPRKSPTKTVKLNENIKVDLTFKKNESNLIKPKQTNKNETKSPKKSSNKTNAQLSPRQTLITVNVTLKSPKRNKRKSHTVKTIEHSQQNNETSDSSTPEITVTNTTMEQEQKQPDLQPEPEPEDERENKDSDPENEEVDDIELIFTTDETTSVIKEELVSIADGAEDCDTPILLNYKTVDFDTPDLHLSCDQMDKELDDDVFQENEATDNFENENTENFNFQQICNSKSDNSINKENESQRDKSLKSCYSYQDSSFESRSLDKDESFDKFDDKEKYLHNMWSNNSVLVETDISKCGIVDPELPITNSRRNTCPNPVPYRPIMHREAIAKHNTRTFAVKFSRNENTPRPILNETQSPKTESEAQTDISALPNFWKSESYLAHKVQHQFTTLPSKFPMPISQKSLRLSDKTKEARRVLLSDINFTSMVPELSRSADHLYQENQEVAQPCGYGQYLNPQGPQLLRRYNTGDSLTSPNFIHSQKFTWSPSDYSNFSSTKFDNSNMYLNRYRGSLTSINQNSFDLPDNVKRRGYSTSNWRHNVPQSFDNSRYGQTGHGPYRSVPNSPTRSRSVPFISSHLHQYPSSFKHSHSRFGKTGYGGLRYINGSLPELSGDHDSGDSTDSLVEEAEQYLRSSIDCIVSGRDLSHISHTKRRASAPCPTRDSSPPRNWQPFLPHGIKDLRSENWVKVIGPEGKIRGGRVRYVGYVLGQPEPYVGIELASNVGNSDGSFNNRRYFECSPNHALFIPFKKVVMGWRN